MFRGLFNETDTRIISYAAEFFKFSEFFNDQSDLIGSNFSSSFSSQVRQISNFFS